MCFIFRFVGRIENVGFVNFLSCQIWREYAKIYSSYILFMRFILRFIGRVESVSFDSFLSPLSLILFYVYCIHLKLFDSSSKILK
jgi:hypothetical protein